MQWSIDAAATEFGIDRRTLRKRLQQAGVSTGRGITYSTAQILDAMRTATDGEQLDGEAAMARLNEEKADEVAMRNASARMELIHAEDLFRRFGPLMTDLVATIEASPLSDQAKDDMRGKIAAIFDRAKTLDSIAASKSSKT
jgi:transposase-like protein